MEMSDQTFFISGIFYACSALGPAIGFVIGGQCLSLYVDFYRVNKYVFCLYWSSQPTTHFLVVFIPSRHNFCDIELKFYNFSLLSFPS